MPYETSLLLLDLNDDQFMHIGQYLIIPPAITAFVNFIHIFFNSLPTRYWIFLYKKHNI